MATEFDLIIIESVYGEIKDKYGPHNHKVLALRRGIDELKTRKTGSWIVREYKGKPLYECPYCKKTVVTVGEPPKFCMECGMEAILDEND